MPESKTDRIVDAVKGELAAIVGDGGTTYWLTPERVVRWAGVEGSLFDESLSTVYVLIPDDGEKRRDSNRTHLADIKLDLWLMTGFTGIEGPYSDSPDSPSRVTLQSRMAQDVEKKLISDPALNAYRGLDITDVRITAEERSAEATFVEGWAVVILRLLIQYRYRFSDL
jgi:hypothetical protein